MENSVWLHEQTSHSVQSPKHTKICLTDMPRLSQAQRNQAIGMLRAGVAPVAVSRVFGCSRITIFNLITRMQQTGDVADRPRAGRPRVTTLRQDRAIRLTHLRDRFQPATVTARQYRVSGQTIRNRLKRQERPVRAVQAIHWQ